MKVKELIKILESVDENLEVFIDQQNDNYSHSPAESAKPINITLYDGDEPMCEEIVISISDELNQ